MVQRSWLFLSSQDWFTLFRWNLGFLSFILFAYILSGHMRKVCDYFDFLEKILLSESRFTSSGSLDACFSFCQFCVRHIFRGGELIIYWRYGIFNSKNVSTFLSKLIIIAFLEQGHGPRNLVYKQERKSFLQIPTLLSQNFISQSRPSSHTRMFSRHTQGNLESV